MMHYRKGENVENEITKDDLPFKDCLPSSPAGQVDFLWMHVKGGTKVSNVVSYAKNALEKGEYRTVVWSGSGGGVVKTISCAEILKRDYQLYQVTRMCYTTVEEHWKPQIEGLEEIVANRQIPCIHILMSLDALDDSISGLQKPNTKTDFWIYSSGNSSSSASSSKPRRENMGKGRQQHSGNQKSLNTYQQQRPPKTPGESREHQSIQNSQNQQENSNRHQKKSKSQNKSTPQQHQQPQKRQNKDSADKSLTDVSTTEPMSS